MRGPISSNRVCKFGNNGRLPSEGKYFIPATLARKEVILEMDVVDSDIPLLLSKQAMKKAKMNIDLEDDTVTAFGNKEKLLTTSGGHYCMSLLGEAEEKDEGFIDEVLSVDLLNIPDKEHWFI